jgi:hypothetical protein
MAAYEDVKTFIEASAASTAKQSIMLRKLAGLSSPGSDIDDNELKIIFEGTDFYEKFCSR